MKPGQILRHPGPRAEARFMALPCRVQPVELRLAAGIPFDRAVAQAFADHGFPAGYLRLSKAQFDQLCYVIPAPAPGDGRAAWYSATHRLTQATMWDGGLHLGRKDGAAFLHCHGLWSETGGEVRAGHLLSPESILAREVVARGWGVSGAALEVRHDPETGFDLFAPVAVSDRDKGDAALLATMRPNEDPHAILTEIARTLPQAAIEGVGSLVHTHFISDQVESYATEVLLREGRIDHGVVTLSAAAVGFDGVPKTGLLKPNANRICITAELLLIADTGGP
ncbi:MAG: hypothetical protein ACK5M4_13270 [Pseudorhodobacter sp.]